MTKMDYLNELEKHLKALPKADYQEAMDYFTEYFDDAGIENEQAVMLELGTPQEAARDIISNILDKKITETKKSPRTKLQILWITLLAICAAPIGFFLLLIILSILASMIITILCLIVAATLVAFALFLIGITFLWESLTLISSPFAVLAMGFGAGLTALGASILIAILVWLVIKLVYRLAAYLIRKLIERGKRS